MFSLELGLTKDIIVPMKTVDSEACGLLGVMGILFLGKRHFFIALGTTEHSQNLLLIGMEADILKTFAHSRNKLQGKTPLRVTLGEVAL